MRCGVGDLGGYQCSDGLGGGYGAAACPRASEESRGRARCRCGPTGAVGLAAYAGMNLSIRLTVIIANIIPLALLLWLAWSIVKSIIVSPIL